MSSCFINVFSCLRSTVFHCTIAPLYFCTLYTVHAFVPRGGAVASWLVRFISPDRVVPISSPGWGHCQCCVLGQDTLLSQCLSQPRSINGYQLVDCWGNLTTYWGSDLRWTNVPSRGVEIHVLLAASCYRNRDKLQQL